ncbi:MAG: sporulation protein YqfC [Firmicutes bacterium]|nr:sporulation protein YqfC [Bacillota bacterium]
MQGKEQGEQGRKKRWRENVADFFELPKELLCNLPRATIIGNVQLHLENYGGIIEYTNEILRLKIRGGEMVIKGENLVIKHFFGEEIFVEGRFQSIAYF